MREDLSKGRQLEQTFPDITEDARRKRPIQTRKTVGKDLSRHQDASVTVGLDERHSRRQDASSVTVT